MRFVSAASLQNAQQVLPGTLAVQAAGLDCPICGHSALFHQRMHIAVRIGEQQQLLNAGYCAANLGCDL